MFAKAPKAAYVCFSKHVASATAPFMGLDVYCYCAITILIRIGSDCIVFALFMHIL